MAKACDFTGLGYSLNPVKVGQTFILSVALHDLTWGAWSEFTWGEISIRTWEDAGGL